MIKNERQYRIAKAQADKFAHALAQLSQHARNGVQVHPLLQKAQEDALRSQLEDLRTQLADYEALQSGKRTVLELDSLTQLPRALIQARIASRLSQRELAERLGLKEQQIQRYEATEYAGASLTRIMEVIRALGIYVREEVFLPSSKASLAALFKRLNKFGLDRAFVIRRFLSQPLAACLDAERGTAEEGADSFVLHVAATVSRVFGWEPTAIFGSTPLQLNMAMVGAPRFKVTTRADERRLNAYTVYAHYLALLVLAATFELPRKPIPIEANEVRKAVLFTYGSITFEHVLRYVWSLGVPVLPLNDSGAFHGACWRVDERNVIVLKQQTQSTARWLIDLLHEFRHAGHEPERDRLSVIEADEMTHGRQESLDEEAATQFAGDVVLAGRAEELAELCVQAAKGSVERLKAVVPHVATRENVPVDALANYMAFRLSLQGINWWGAATNLQVAGPDPWQIARDLLLERAKFECLNEVDRNLLLRALSHVEV